MQQDWNIKVRSDACGITAKPFAEGEVFYTVLFRDGEEFRRMDLCEEAWNARASDPSAEPIFSSWRSKFEPPPPPAPEPLPRDDAEGMLRRLIETADPAHANTLYLLAVMLERKRVLRPQVSPDQDTLIYEHASTGETFIVRDPRLSLADLESVQQEVSSLLAGLTAPGAQSEEGAREPEAPATADAA